MDKPNFEAIVKELEESAQSLNDNARLGDSKITSAFARMISVMGWSSHQSDTNNHQVANLTNEIKDLKDGLREYGNSAKEESNRMFWLTVILGFIAVLQVFIGYKQMIISQSQGISEQIMQAKNIQSAIGLCSQNKNLKDSGLFEVATGKSASCEDVLELYTGNSFWVKIKNIFLKSI